jgi:hypothetical protein
MEIGVSGVLVIPKLKKRWRKRPLHIKAPARERQDASKPCGKVSKGSAGVALSGWYRSAHEHDDGEASDNPAAV